MPLAACNLLLEGIQGGTHEERGTRGVRGEAAVAQLRSEIARLSELRKRG